MKKDEKEKNQKLESKKSKVVKEIKEEIPIFVGKKETKEITSKEKKVFFAKLKSKESRKSFKIAVREFPAKMAKEIGRIHWAKKDGWLGKKFVITLLFILFSALFFYGADKLLSLILHSAFIF